MKGLINFSFLTQSGNIDMELKKILLPILISNGGVLNMAEISRERHYGISTVEEIEQVLLKNPKIKYYGRVDIHEHYGDGLKVSADETQKAINDFRENGINYEESSDLFDFEGSHFNGTDQDSSSKWYSYIQIVSNSGNKYFFASETNLQQAISLVRQINDLNLSLQSNESFEASVEKAIEVCQDRLNKCKKEGQWNYFRYYLKNKSTF